MAFVLIEDAMKEEISICHFGGNTEIISKNINIIFENKEYKVSNATVEKCKICGDIFIQERTRNEIKEIIGSYPVGVKCIELEEQIFDNFQEED